MLIVKKTYKDQVIDHIYQMLLADEIQPGDQVKESLLSIQMGISRAPIREAFKELMSIGLIEYRPQVGNFIPILTPKQIIDSYTTRGVLEGYAVMAASEIFSEDDLNRLDRFVDAMGVAARDGQRKQVVEIGGNFHDFLAAHTDNLQLLEFTGRLSLKLHILFYKHLGLLYTAEEIELRHRAIVESIKSRDNIRIEKVIRSHYVETGTKIAALQSIRSKTAA